LLQSAQERTLASLFKTNRAIAYYGADGRGKPIENTEMDSERVQRISNEIAY